MEGGKTYIDFFNSGYKLARYQAALFEQIKDGLNTENEMNQAIIDGGNQWLREKESRAWQSLMILEITGSRRKN